MANHNLSRVILLGGLSVNLNHLKIKIVLQLLTILLKETITDKMFLSKKQFLVMFLTFFSKLLAK